MPQEINKGNATTLENIPPLSEEELETYHLFDEITFRGIRGRFIKNCLHFIIIYQPSNGIDGSLVEIGKSLPQQNCILNVGGLELLQQFFPDED
jgi:hypothetical protein